MAPAHEHIGRIDRIGLRNVEAVVDAPRPCGELAAHGHACRESRPVGRTSPPGGSVSPAGRRTPCRSCPRGSNRRSRRNDAERTAGDHLDHPGGDVDADAVAPARPRLKSERKPRQILNRRFKRALGVHQLGRVVHFAEQASPRRNGRKGRSCASSGRAPGSGEPDRRDCRRPAYLHGPEGGMYLASGSMSLKRPSSSKVISATQMIGLVIE